MPLKFIYKSFIEKKFYTCILEREAMEQKNNYTIIITEKPDAARRIAEALAESNTLKTYKNEDGVTYYEFIRNGKNFIVVCAVGHLFNLAPKEKKWIYPIFDYTWKPSFQVRKSSAFSKKYFDVIKSILKNGSDYIIATDYDIEGEVIGANILKFLANKNDAKRMVYSTLTKDEIIESYENALPHLDINQLESGLTRHELDWLWGINLTRALTLSLKNNEKKLFSILSTGRVQAPTLRILFEKEEEIRNFKPKPFWQLKLHLDINGKEFIANYKEEKIWKKEEADKILKMCKDCNAIVKDIKKRKYKLLPPVPFNTTDLQAEAYAQFNFSPTQTMTIAESLYQQGWISYPRSSSQKIPIRINYEKLLKALETLKPYEKFVKEILKKSRIIPREGSHEDPAHYAIIPTWEVPDLSKLTLQQKKIYDLIVRRTLAAFEDEAIKESMNVIFDVNGYDFIITCKRTIEHGWIKIYEPYMKIEEQTLPELKIGQLIKVLRLEEILKETQPPGRYSQGSIIKEMEARNLGTRCITGDTTILILNNGHVKEVKIEEIFEEDNSFEHENERFFINSEKMCFCVNENDFFTSRFTLISRRELNKHEKVYQITFEDGSKIKLTEEHPVLIHDGTFKYLPVKNLSTGMKVISIFPYYEKTGNKIEWEDFIKKLNSKSKLYSTIELKEWRKNKGLSQKKLAKILRLRQSTIANWEKKRMIPLWVWKKIDLPIPRVIYSTNKKFPLKNPFPLTISSSLIRILAHIIADGSLDREKLKKENCFDFRYTNKNIELINKFVDDISKIFNINEIKINRDKRDENKYYVKLPAIIGRILGILFKDLIFKKVNISDEFYPDFIGAVFDDEGHSYKNEVKISISNTNFFLIKTLENYLKKLGFSPYVKEENKKYKKKNWSRLYKLFLYGRDVCKFLELIPIYHKKKKERIIKNLSEKYKYFNINEPQLLLEKKVLSYLPKDGATIKEIALATNLNENTIRTCLKNLRKNGYINVKIISISKQPRKKIIYIPLKECSKTFYSFLNENILSSTLLTKTIRKIEEIEYKGYVYDITNNLVPNFVLGNNVVVHNSTRSEILQTLYDRRYIIGKSIQVTKLGEIVVKTLEKFSPRILSEELTRYFEQQMNLVYEGKKKRQEIIEEAKKTLKEILEEFKKNEDKISKELSKGLIEALEEERKIGKCKCGGELRIIKSRKTGKIFIGCSNYPNCKISYPLPLASKIEKTGKICDKCGTPIIKIFRKGKKPFQMCLSISCPKKEEWKNNKIKNTTKHFSN